MITATIANFSAGGKLSSFTATGKLGGGSGGGGLQYPPYMSTLIDFTAASSVLISAPVGYLMYLDSIDLYISQFTAGAGLVQPTLQLGVTGTAARYRQWQTTLLMGLLTREIQNVFSDDTPVNQFLLTVLTPASGVTIYKGFAILGGKLIPTP